MANGAGAVALRNVSTMLMWVYENILEVGTASKSCMVDYPAGVVAVGWSEEPVCKLAPEVAHVPGLVFAFGIVVPGVGTVAVAVAVVDG